MSWDANGGSKGFDLQHSSSTPVVTVSNGGNSTITANGNDADTNYGTIPMLVTLERESSTTYQFSMTSRSGGTGWIIDSVKETRASPANPKFLPQSITEDVMCSSTLVRKDTSA